MKYLTIILLRFFTITSNAQVVFSDERPSVSITVEKLNPSIDTVFMLTPAGIEKDVRVTENYTILYEKTKKHEDMEFSSPPVFLVVDKGGAFTKKVVPIAYRLSLPAVVFDRNTYYKGWRLYGN